MSTAKAAWIAENLKAGERYAGILLGKNGDPDRHIILLPGEATKIKWHDAVKWAKAAGGALPTRREQSLLIANLKEAFQPRYYWSGEQHASYPFHAWGQHFSNGTQDVTSFSTSYEGFAVAVRSVVIL